MSLAEEPYGTALIIAALFQSVLASARGESAHAGVEKWEGRRFAPPPLNQLRTGGGDGCRNEVRRDGDGRRARPPGSNRRRGRRMPTVRPIRSGLAEPQRNELRRVARLHLHEDRTLAVLLRVLERTPDVGPICHPL